MKVFLVSKKLYNITKNPQEGTLDISKLEYMFKLRIRTIFRCIKRDILNLSYFPFYLNCVGKVGNGKGLGNLFLCIEKLFWFSIWKYILVLKYPMFLSVDFQLHCTIFSSIRKPSNLNYPILGHFPLYEEDEFISRRKTDCL